MNSPIHYPGGKNGIAHKIIPYIPDHKSYLEPFFGSGGVFFNKRKVAIETINDLNSDVINLFRVLQDEKKFEKFYRIVSMTPYSREIFNESKDYEKHEIGSIKRAALYFINIRFSFSGSQHGWSFSTNNTNDRKHCQSIGKWLYTIKQLPQIAQRLKQVQIENDDFESVMIRFDNPDCFIYADPPYLVETRKSKKLYKHEMTDKDHERFLKTCLMCKSSVMISGYNSDIYNEYLSGWYKKEIKVKLRMNNSRLTETQDRTEVLWMNYKNEKQPDLFDKEEIQKLVYQEDLL